MPTWKRLFIHLIKLLSVLINTGLFIGCCRLFYMDSIITMAVFQVELAIYIAYSFVLAILMKTYNAFDSNMSSVNEQFFSAMLSAAILNALTYVIMGVGVLKIPNPIPLLGLTACQCIVNAVWVPLCKCFGNVLYRQNSKTVIVYQTDADLQKLYDIKKYKHLFSVQKYIKNPQSIQSLIKELEGFDVVFVAGIHATLRNGIAKYCVENDICAYIEPRIGDVLLAGAKHTRAFSIPTLRVTKASPAPEYLFIKRAFDIFASALAIILTSPIMAAVAIAIKLDDGGPIFYKQKRLTKDRKEFKILKFRSMCVDAEKDGVARLTSKNDARITRVGRIIRKCRADELPQLFNILFGSMTIVGPRPERKEIAEQYEETIPAFRLRLQVKAGLTGYAQIFGRYNTHPYDKLQMDLMYINKMSIVEDLFLMMATVKILFSGKSAEGIEDGEITADTRVNEDVKESA